MEAAVAASAAGGEGQRRGARGPAGGRGRGAGAGGGGRVGRWVGGAGADRRLGVGRTDERHADGQPRARAQAGGQGHGGEGCEVTRGGQDDEGVALTAEVARVVAVATGEGREGDGGLEQEVD